MERNEKRIFSEWITNIIDTYPKQINYFESNLETWRQLWRVVERSEVVLMIVDTRFGSIQFNSKVCEWVKSLGKGFGVLLNKTDLVDTTVVMEWKEYFKNTFDVPTLEIKTNRAIDGNAEDFDIATIRSEKKKDDEKEECVESVIQTTHKDFEEFVFSLRPKHNEKKEEIEDEEEFDDEMNDSDEEEYEEMKKKQQKSKKLVVGLIGNPNVGKSSLLNWLVGKKVTSVSSHPGRTKYLQTYNMNKQITLADCPGMMFPMINQSQLIQVICGIYPLSQLREPYSIVRFFLERLPLEKIYHIPLEENMSVIHFVEEFALKNNYITGKAGRPDTHKAAREILTDCITGRIIFMFEPPK